MRCDPVNGLFSIKKKGSKKFRNILRCTKEVKTNTVSWQKALNDASITNTEILQSHDFASNKILHPQFHDKKFRLLCRKTQFNNQLNKHNTNQSPFCEWCQEHLKMDIKESLVHALWDCPKISNIYTNTLQALKIDHLTQLPLSAQQVILYDSFATAKNLINSVWILMLCSILTSKYNNSPINQLKLTNKIKREIRDTNKSYPNRSLNTECRYLSLEDFLASYEAKGFHWTIHKTSAKI